MAERKRIGAVVVATEKMLWGSLGVVYRGCGKPTCHCATGEKHGPVFYLTRGERGHTRNIYVPAELLDEVEAGVAAYRRYRELGQEIAEANAQRLGLEKKKRRRR
jgi:hypothetical protein